MSPGAWKPGDLVDAYRLVEKVGSGGMGEVFLATHQATGADYAIKTLHAGDPELLLRFQREAEAMARAEGHPAVARIHTVGTHAGRAFLVMEYLQGGTLSDRLAEGPLAAREAASLTSTLARGLQHLHSQGILHRDLKPDNVLFSEDGQVKLGDFGLAHVADARSLTEEGTVLGTPAYMAPEQALSVKEVGPRLDVYGLGAVLYHCLAGAPPFAGTNPITIMAAVVADPPPRPSQRRGSPIDPTLEAICLRCLEKDPERRYASAEALAEALEAWSRRTPTGNRRGLALALAGSAALFTGVGVALQRGARPELAQGVAASPTANTPSPSSATPLPTSEPAPRAPRKTWNPEPDRMFRVSRAEHARRLRLAFSDERLLAISGDGILQTWTLEPGEPPQASEAQRYQINARTLLAHGDQVFLGGEDPDRKRGQPRKNLWWWTALPEQADTLNSELGTIEATFMGRRLALALEHRVRVFAPGAAMPVLLEASAGRTCCALAYSAQTGLLAGIFGDPSKTEGKAKWNASRGAWLWIARPEADAEPREHLLEVEGGRLLLARSLVFWERGDETSLLVGTDVGRITEIELETGKPQHSLLPPGPSALLTISQPGSVVRQGMKLSGERLFVISAGGASENVMAVWDLANWRQVAQLSLSEKPLALALSPDGLLAVGLEGGEVLLWDTFEPR